MRCDRSKYDTDTLKIRLKGIARDKCASVVPSPVIREMSFLPQID